MKKKVIAILLSLCMAVSGSSAVFAADDDGIILGEITEPEDENSGEESEDFSAVSVVGTAIDSTDDITYIVPEGWTPAENKNDTCKYYEKPGSSLNSLVVMKNGIDCSSIDINSYTVDMLLSSTFTGMCKTLKSDDYELIGNVPFTYDDNPALIKAYTVDKVAMTENTCVCFVAFLVTSDLKGITISYITLVDDNDVSERLSQFVDSIGMVSSVRDNLQTDITFSDTDVYGDGEYVVGKDIDAGRYRLNGLDESEGTYSILNIEEDSTVLDGTIADNSEEKYMQLNSGSKITLKNCKIAKENE